jgi:hypothetical protein
MGKMLASESVEVQDKTSVRDYSRLVAKGQPNTAAAIGRHYGVSDYSWRTAGYENDFRKWQLHAAWRFMTPRFG